MKCREIRKQLYLLAGEDLPENEKARLLSHLVKCQACASDLAAIKRSREGMAEIARHDLPDPLPPDFPHNLIRAFAAGNNQTQRKRLRWPWNLRERPALVGAVSLVAVLMVAGTLYKILTTQEITPEQLFEKLQMISGTAGPELKLGGDPGHIIFKAFDQPARLDAWDSPEQAGIYVILHKLDPENRPDTYVIDYCGQGRNLSLYKSYPWIEHRKKRLISRTGSLDNAYISVFLMPGSTRQERRKLEQALIKTLNPYFNTEVRT